MVKKLEDKKLGVAYLGEVGFPRGFAAIQRQMLLSMGLVANGCTVTVLNFKGAHPEKVQLPVQGEVNGVRYLYTAGSIHRPAGFLARNRQKLFGRYREWQVLRRMKKEGALDVCIVSTRNFWLLVLYWFWLRMIGLPFVLSSVELRSAIPGKDQKPGQKLNNYLFEHYGFRMADGVLPISDYLQEISRQRAPRVPTLKAPIICDFDEFALEPEDNGEVQLVYCGSPSYAEVIHFVLEAFDRLTLPDREVYLDLILGGGSRADVQRVREKIGRMDHADRVRIHRNISREAVAQLYANASALLIPLRPTLQDKARFPHKIGEYLAAGNPVVTTAIGEILHYPFRDGENALVAAAYDIGLYAGKLQQVVDDPGQARQIGQRGREMGLQYFDHLKLGRSVGMFLASICGRSLPGASDGRTSSSSSLTKAEATD